MKTLAVRWGHRLIRDFDLKNEDPLAVLEVVHTVISPNVCDGDFCNFSIEVMEQIEGEFGTFINEPLLEVTVPEEMAKEIVDEVSRKVAVLLGRPVHTTWDYTLGRGTPDF